MRLLVILSCMIFTEPAMASKRLGGCSSSPVAENIEAVYAVTRSDIFPVTPVSCVFMTLLFCKRSANPPLRVGADQGNAVFFPVPRQKFVEFFVGPGRELFQHIAEVSEGLDAVEFARFDNAVEGRGTFTTRIISNK